jgi:branched-chain amino acid transport system ATP-binding protein
MIPLLEIQALHAGYGASEVLFGIDLVINEGEVATLLGRNGMGKTTTIKTIMGFVSARAGQLLFRGQSLATLSTDRIARIGIALVPEGRQIFRNLTVQENLLAFAANRNSTAKPWTLSEIYGQFPRLAERASHMGNQLSGGEQQMLAIGRALMTNPHLLILDEATEGLAPLVRTEIWQCLAALKLRGQTLLVVDKYINELLKISDHHTIIEKGKVVWRGDSTALAANQEIWHRYLGV